MRRSVPEPLSRRDGIDPRGGENGRPATKKKSIVCFAPGHSETVDPDPAELGGKGANLLALCRMGLPVPPGFIIGTRFCEKYAQKGRLPVKLVEGVRQGLEWLQGVTGKRFGSRRRPLLLAVRSGAPTSMPGMMDTILNIGLNDEAVKGLERHSGNPRFAWDSYRRLVTMYGDSVLGVPRTLSEELLASARAAEGLQYDWELDSATLAKVTRTVRSRIFETSGREFPQDPERQLLTAIEAVFASSSSERSRAYCDVHGIEEQGTAVTVQAMVFGNSGANSGSGVAFSRDPSTGENRLHVEFLYNAQGEDVVSGARSPNGDGSLERADPEIYRQLRAHARRLEEHFRDMQDIEFTVEDGRLYLLQTRVAKRSPRASLRVVTDMIEENLIGFDEGLERLAGIPPDQFKIRRLLPPAGLHPVARGSLASTGVAVGEVAFTSEKAVSLRSEGKDVILVREETQADDIRGMEASVGLLTSRGGTTSHAAVVARQLGLCCIVGCEDLRFLQPGGVTLGEVPLAEGQVISLDGHTGAVYACEVVVASAEEGPEMKRLRALASAEGRALPF